MSSSSDHPHATVPWSVAVVTESAVAEQGHVVTELDEAVGEERREELPRTVVTRRCPPRDRRQHGDPQRRVGGVALSERRNARGYR